MKNKKLNVYLSPTAVSLIWELVAQRRTQTEDATHAVAVSVLLHANSTRVVSANWNHWHSARRIMLILRIVVCGSG